MIEKSKKEVKIILTMVIELIMIMISELPIRAAEPSYNLITHMNQGIKIFGLALFLIGMALIFFTNKYKIYKLGFIFIMVAIIIICIGIIIA